MRLRGRAGLLLVAFAVVAAAATTAFAQTPRFNIPIPTTLTMERVKAPPGTGDSCELSNGFGCILWIGVASKKYPFLLRDAFTTGPGGGDDWVGIWQWSRQFRPSFEIKGTRMFDVIAYPPGQLITVSGIYFASTATFEVDSIVKGRGLYEKPEHF
jgi:hypothetical protein